MAEYLTLQGDVRQTLRQLPECSVHCAITSPPYWALRSYLPKNHALKALELGSEPTPEEYIRNMVGVFDEVRRVLRDDGTCWVNLGDTYGGTRGNKTPAPNTKWADPMADTPGNGKGDTERGQRIGIPERFAIAMQQAGWIWRDTVIWHKPAPMPSSVTGWQWVRCRVKVAKAERAFKGHERLQGARADNGKDFASTAGWEDCPGCPKCRDTGGLILRRGSWRTTAAHEPIFMFAKTSKYFCDGVGAREKATTSTKNRNQYTRKLDDPDEPFAVKHDHEFTGLTRNPRSVRIVDDARDLIQWLEERHPDVLQQMAAEIETPSVWRIASGGSSLRHYAMFPLELPERIIEVATPTHGVCAKCGAPWARVVKTNMPEGSWVNHENDEKVGLVENFGRKGDAWAEGYQQPETMGWRATCDCGCDERVPAIVLDPFGGSGTTAEAALKLGRDAVVCELNPEYVELVDQRIACAKKRKK